MKKRILIVDDEPSIAVSLEFLMSQQGYDVRVATDGDEALSALEEQAPDLILLDVMLPGRSGFELCRIIRESESWQHVKVIMVTAKGREVDVEKGMSLGADDYVTKPFSIREVVDRVRMHLEDEGS